MATDHRAPALPPREWDAAGYDALPLPHERWGQRLLVFSVATLHWLPDHAAVFRSLAGVLRPGGLLRAEWGGAGNCATVETALAQVGLPPLNAACNFATDGDTAQRLRDAGFTDVHTALVPDPARFEPGAQLEAFLGTVVLGSVLEQVPVADRAELVHRVAARLPEPSVDYVRLQAYARRSG
jgi:trans-aconitate 2-methyltransferase